MTEDELEQVEKATVGTAERNNLPDSAFAYIEPGGVRDSTGKTVPRSKRHFLIHDPAHVRDALARIGQGAQFGTEALPKVRAAAERFGIDATVTKAEFESVVPLWKDDARQLVYGVVLAPGVRDSQGDKVTAEDIEKAAHRFLVEFRKHDIQHSDIPAPVATVESYIAPQDLTFVDSAGKEQKVLKGSWVLVSHIKDRDTWDRVSKADHPEPLTGYSMAGSGVRLPDEKE